MKTVLIPTNFSFCAQNALKFTLSFFQKTTAQYRILLLNTYLIPPLHPSQIIETHDELKQKSMEMLEKERKMAEKLNRNQNISFDILSSMGTLENVMAYLIESHQVDCVIMGVGNNKKGPHLLDRLGCPLLMVPLEAPQFHEPF